MVVRVNILIRPHMIINNQLTLPLVGVNDAGKATIRGLIQMSIPITIFLDTMFNKKAGFSSRQLDNEQYHIYKSLEGILEATGVDGKACLLRTICEMQKNPIGEFTVIGEIMTILLTPKRGLNDFLHEYIEAEQIGQSVNTTCFREYSRKCPISLYNLFQASSKTSENELDEDDNEDYESQEFNECSNEKKDSNNSSSANFHGQHTLVDSHISHILLNDNES